jgi:hypothetical protein
MSKYKFNPLEYGYEPITKFPELSYNFPMTDNWFVKVITYDKMTDLVYWYSIINNDVGMGGDDRIKISNGSYNFISRNFRQTNTSVKYSGLISSHNLATELLKNIFGTIKNDSVETVGEERFLERLGPTMRKEFSQHYTKVFIEERNEVIDKLLK